MSARVRIGCVLLAGVSVARPLLAQPFTLNDKIKPTEIKLEPYRTARYRVDAARLTTTGLGATRPKEPNDTAEGRARNRRVELVRQ